MPCILQRARADTSNAARKVLEYHCDSYLFEGQMVCRALQGTTIRRVFGPNVRFASARVTPAA